MAKKQRGHNRKFWNLYYHLKTIRHPILREKPIPSHTELLVAATELFGVDTVGKSKREAIDLIFPHLPGTGATTQARRVKLKRRRDATSPPDTSLSKEWIAFVVGDAFLQSYEWRRLRYEVLKKNDGLCELCGQGKPHGQVLNVDHIKCRRKYPELALDIKNLQILCGPCNHGKGNWDSTDWRNRTPEVMPEEREWERVAWARFDGF